MDADDMLYIVAMLLFASIPVESLAKNPTPHTPSRVAALVAFMMLMVLQVRKHYSFGIAMVSLNLGLRVADSLRSLSDRVSVPRTRKKAPCADGLL